MRAERPRAARYPFLANVTLTDLESGYTVVAKTRDLSLFGCRLVLRNSTPAGTRVRLQITYKGDVFEAFGRVANAGPSEGLGIVFTKIEERHQSILEKWIVELRIRKHR
jgi:hypothetical protein